MTLIEKYLDYVKNVRRYSSRTFNIYKDVLENFRISLFPGTVSEQICDDAFLEALNPSEIRSYEVSLLDEKGLDTKTVNLHLSVLS